MTRISRFAVPATAALLLAACGSDEPKTSAAPPADSANMVKATSALPGAIGGAPARAQEGVNTSNAAVEQRASDVDALSREANGAGTGSAATP